MNFYAFYKFFKNIYLRKIILRIAVKCERGPFYSHTLRRVAKDIYKIDIGKYSYGGCFNFQKIWEETYIGRYCSIGSNVTIINANHPYTIKSTHPFFYQSKYGYSKDDLRTVKPIRIENDVWIGNNVTILPAVGRIGNGAIIGAGSVVTKDVPDYAIVGGNPAKIIKYRFSDSIIRELLHERWWEKDIDDLENVLNKFVIDLSCHNNGLV